MRVLGLGDKASIEALEKDRLEKAPGDPFEKEMSAWSARWRSESLDHYLALGWSFGLWEGDLLTAYILGQPLLFFQSHAQTLWVEHMTFGSPEQGHKLIEIVYRWSRDKHLQKVLFSVHAVPESFRTELSLKLNEEGMFELPTAKYK